MRKIKRAAFFVFFAAVFFSSVFAQTALYLSPSDDNLTEISQWRVSFSDSAVFASPEYDDSHWPQDDIVGLWNLEEGSATGIRWYRTKVFISEYIPFTENLAIFIPMIISAYEVYWDGVKIGESGRVGSSAADETVGNSAGTFVVPREFSFIGEHRLAIRVSNFSTLSGFIENSPLIGFLSDITYASAQTLSFSFFIVGILLITAFFNIVFIARSLNVKAHVTYAALSFCCCGHILIPVFTSVYPAPLRNFYSIALVGDIFWLGVLILLPTYLYLIFNDKHWKIKTGILFAVCAVLVLFPRLALYEIVPVDTLWLWDFANIVFAAITVIVSIAIAVRASFQRKKGAKTLLAGLLIWGIGVLSSLIFYADGAWAAGFAFLSVFVTIVMGRFFWDEMRKKSAAEAKNARLELELLKGHIQPHFLLNSLNSIVAWIEEEPKVATKLISELSKELRLLMAFAERKTVSLSEEISLCRAHIQVMNLRKEKEIKLKVEGVAEGVSIPPLILHTALENGITHGFVKKETGTFTLKVERLPKRIKIILQNDGSGKVAQNTKESGTGNQYIIQRLHEIYAKDFVFYSRPKSDESGWEVVFDLPAGDTTKESGE